jgi:hypothetical protein
MITLIDCGQFISSKDGQSLHYSTVAVCCLPATCLTAGGDK